jgi:hypothetical protein
METNELNAAGKLPLGLSKSRDSVMTDLEAWLSHEDKGGISTHYDGCHKKHYRCMMEKAHEEIALLRLRLLRLTVAGTPADPVTHVRDPMRILRKQIKHMRGQGEPVEEMLLLDGLESAYAELARHRSLL